MGDAFPEDNILERYRTDQIKQISSPEQEQTDVCKDKPEISVDYSHLHIAYGDPLPDLFCDDFTRYAVD